MEGSYRLDVPGTNLVHSDGAGNTTSHRFLLGFAIVGRTDRRAGAFSGGTEEASSELVLFLHFGPDGFDQAVVASYGALCWGGCNRHDLAFVNNDLMLVTTVPGLPSQIVRRLILQERSVPAALELLRALRHMAGRSYLLGDASGAVAGVEVGARVNQRGSSVLHTNHALDRDIAADESETETPGDLSIEPPSPRRAAAQAAGTGGRRRHRGAPRR